MEILRSIMDFANAHGLSTLVALVAAQWALGVSIAFRDHEFDLQRTSDVLRKSGPMVLGFAVCDLLLKQPGLAASVFGVIVAQLSADITCKLGNLFPMLGKILPKQLIPKF